MLAAAQAWQQSNDTPNGTRYSWRGPNSNSFAEFLGEVGGFSPPRPPGAVGWGYYLH